MRYLFYYSSKPLLPDWPHIHFTALAHTGLAAFIIVFLTFSCWRKTSFVVILYCYHYAFILPWLLIHSMLRLSHPMPLYTHLPLVSIPAFDISFSYLTLFFIDVGTILQPVQEKNDITSLLDQLEMNLLSISVHPQKCNVFFTIEFVSECLEAVNFFPLPRPPPIGVWKR